MTRTLIRSATAAILSMTVAVAAHAQVAMSVVRIDRALGYPVDLNANGTVLMGSSSGAVLWNAVGGTVALPFSPEAPIALNDAGHVIAWSSSDVPGHFFDGATWRPMTGIDQNGNAAAITVAIAINNSDHVIGTMDNYGRQGIWSPDGTIRDLPAGFYPTDINNAGVVVGNMAEQQALQPYLWDAVNGLRPVLYGYAYARSINNLGQVAGHFVYTLNNIHTLFYDGSTARDLGVLGGYLDFENERAEISMGMSLNDLGQIVGHTTLNDGSTRAFVWDAVSGMRQLGASTSAYSQALRINNAGLVLGVDLDGGFVASVPAPVPPTPQAQTAQVAVAVTTLVTGGSITPSAAAQITGPLDNAVKMLDKGNGAAAKNQIESAIKKVDSLLKKGDISVADAASIRNALLAVLAGL